MSAQLSRYLAGEHPPKNDMAEITFKGNPVTTVGTLPATNTPAPFFALTNGDLEERNPEHYSGKVLVLNIVPSLDTGVCLASAKRFNQEIDALEGKAVIANVSADLPFAQGRVCEAEGIKHLDNLSTFRSPTFGTDYGVTIADGPLAGLMSRAVVVLNGEGHVIYTQQVSEIVDEPDYEAALAAVRGA